MAESQKPEWIAKLEKADQEGKTVQSRVDQKAAMSGGSSSSSSGAYTPNNDYNTMANKLANAQKQAQISQLQNAYNNTLNQIAANETQVKDSAQSNRNAASVQSQLAAQQLANRMANLGLQNSGTNAQAMMNNTGALQNTLGGITANEQQALNDLANQRTLAYQNLQNDISSANANADISALQNQLSYLNQMNQLKAQQDYATQQALQQREWNLADMSTQRNWQLEDNKNNSLAYTDPLTGQTSYINPETAVQLNYNKWLQSQQPKVVTTSGGSNANAKAYDSTLLTAYQNYLKNNGLTMDDLSFGEYQNKILGTGNNTNNSSISNNDSDVEPEFEISDDILNELTGKNKTTTKKKTTTTKITPQSTYLSGGNNKGNTVSNYNR